MAKGADSGGYVTTTVSGGEGFDNLVPPPRVPTRPAIFNLVFGNLALGAMVLLIYSGFLPVGLVPVVALIVGIPLANIDSKRQNKLKDWFREHRRPELASYFSSDAEREKKLEEDLAQSIDLAPSINVITALSFIIFAPTVFIFIYDIAQYFQDWWFIFRWPTAIAVGLVIWMTVVLMWAAANLCLSSDEFDYHSLRAQQSDDTPIEDMNDIEIIRQLTSLANLHRRIEAYTLESALLSALSFSSFLGIIIEKEEVLAGLSKLSLPSIEWADVSGTDVTKGLFELGTLPIIRTAYVYENLMELICLSLLFCAVAFLGVLVARLRFNEGYRDAESCLNSAERFNELEDKALDNKDLERQRIYAAEISSMLKRAERMENGLALTVNHMKLSRDTGILFFIIALCLCGLFVNGYIFFIISALFIMALVIGVFDTLARQFLRKNILEQGGRFGRLLAKGLK